MGLSIKGFLRIFRPLGSFIVLLESVCSAATFLQRFERQSTTRLENRPPGSKVYLNA